MSRENLFNEEAIAKLKELAEDIRFAIMGTNLNSIPPHLIPMSTKDVDEDGCVWFLSSSESEHNQNINKDNNIQLIYSKPDQMSFLTVFGQAVIYKGKVVVERYYGSADDAWFDGVDDPNLTAIKVIPKEAQYWDTESGKFISLLKMGIGAITGDKPDLGEHGDLNIPLSN
ncbi:pyridoxamine 5'-phosphate oxidase family protein [Cyclobacterium qasimii]|uniref:General stress protein FMN-binding split barrel domain-containing protein n=2 Tax=Cyclobacterium qasimii TaxID=1350429 RepID=A0A512C8G2_9BACT|nr:pyridoxamine 5'-phosphate oxidase family protein [Cyclobacterium qasimii]EPR71322.1 putative general stress protein 26 [Cyclobacterium qasimii M12-11B]GEO20504.1 hypothetical protein CQA01_10380 [Cyclobacterium qasimii]